MSFVCWFQPCRWAHLFNAVQRAFEAAPHEVGVYQCTRCKTVSVGSPRRGVLKRNDDERESVEGAQRSVIQMEHRNT